MANTHSIHLVVPPKPQQLDAADIAGAVLETVRECREALDDFCEYHDTVVAQMSAQLNALELVALRGIAPKVGRS